ncbi:MAG: hypothetical protein KDK70_38905, partial [Myxococcales bacterium]|nr:hypothetical protein [Myxococcales bacterium]
MPAEPRAPLVAQLMGALALVVGGLVFAAALVSSVGLALSGESYYGTDRLAALIYGSLGAIVLLVGWRAHRRSDPAGRAAAASLARLSVFLGAVGLTLGVA